MSKIFILTKILFKSAILSNTSNVKKKSGKSLIILFLFIGILLVSSYCVPITFVIKEIIVQFGGVITPNIILELFLPLISIAMLIFSVLSVISYYYLSTDIVSLLPLPIKPREILLARFLLVTSNLYLFEFIFFAPILVGYGLGTNSSALFYILLLITLLIIPLIPVAIMSIIITTIMRFGNLTKSKDKFTYVALVISLLFGVSCSILPSYFVDLENVDPSQISNISQIISRFTNYIMPFLRPAITALSTTSPLIAILNTLLFILISLTAVGLFLLISSKVYLKGVMNGSESKSKKKKNDSLVLAKETKRSSVFKTYALKEWRIMFRTPIYNMNLIVVDLIMIVIFGFSFIGGNASGEEGKLMLNEILKFRLPSNNGGYIFFILAGTLFFNGVSAIAATAISREGKTAWFMKFIPVSPILQINAKIFFGIIVHLFVPALLLIVSLAIGIITIVDFIFILIPFILVTIYLNYWCILIDLARPKLNWDNETVAVKQNMNSLFCLFIAFLLALLMVGIGFILTFANTIRENIGWTNLTLISITAGIVLILVSLFMLLKLIKKFKSLINWTLIINLFSLTLLVGGIVLFVGLFELLNHYYQISFGLATWSIIISLCTFGSLILLYKGIVNKGDSMFQNID